MPSFGPLGRDIKSILPANFSPSNSTSSWRSARLCAESAIGIGRVSFESDLDFPRNQAKLVDLLRRQDDVVFSEKLDRHMGGDAPLFLFAEIVVFQHPVHDRAVNQVGVEKALALQVEREPVKPLPGAGGAKHDLALRDGAAGRRPYRLADGRVENDPVFFGHCSSARFA
jgi:hypothetical protein